MKRNKIFGIILIAFLICILLICGTVFAYMFRQTTYEENQFTPAEVSCSVSETFNGEVKSSIKVQNTGNINAYIRLKIVSYWVDSNGSIVPKASEMPAIVPAAGWIEGSNNIYYYQSPLTYETPNNATTEFLSAPIYLEKDENGYMQVVEVFAEAIQCNPTNAVTDSWGVSLNADGAIVAVS